MISALRKENKLQLICKNSKLLRSILEKKESQYKVPVLKLSTENINTERTITIWITTEFHKQK